MVSTTLLRPVPPGPSMQRYAAVLALLLVAGCLGADDEPDDGDAGDESDAGDVPRPPLPAPIEDSQTVTGSADPANFVTGEPCTNEMACTEYPFSVATNVSMSAQLTWTIDASDFDLYLYEGDEQVTLSGATPPGTSESISAALAPGDYRLIVVAWAVTMDTYTLEATFEYA